jgi:hypothetical protein
MATSPNFSWPEPDNTDLVKNGALAIRTAVDAIDSSMADLKGGTTGQVLSKASGTDMDFTWVAQDDSNAIQNAIVDAKGDLIAATAADTPARLAVGTNGQVLTADSTAATGLKWATPTSGSTFRGCAVYNAGGNVTYTSGVISFLNFSTEDYDTNSYHDNSTNNTRITIPSGYAGKYLINQVWRLGVGVGYVITRLYKNGGSVNLGLEGTEMVRVMNQGSNSFGLNASVVLDLAVGDYIEMAVQTDYAGTAGTYARFSASYLGA